MPKRATIEQRVLWHRAHAKHCGCRPIPPPLVALVNAMERPTTVKDEENPLRPLLTGGDRRSIAQSNRARRLLQNDPSLARKLVELTADTDWLVTQRALDLMEKLAHEHPEWIKPYKLIFIGPLADSDKWEIRLQIVRSLPLFDWAPRELKRVEQILLENVEYPQTFVRAWALDSLATFARRNAKLRPVVARQLRKFQRSGSKALVARAKKISERLP